MNNASAGVKDVKDLPEVALLDGKLNLYVHAHGSETYKQLQQLFWEAIEAINKSRLRLDEEAERIVESVNPRTGKTMQVINGESIREAEQPKEDVQEQGITDSDIEAMAEKEFPDYNPSMIIEELKEYLDAILICKRQSFIKGYKAAIKSQPDKIRMEDAANKWILKDEVAALLHTILNSREEIITPRALRDSVVPVKAIETAFDEYFGIKENEPFF